MSVLGGIVGGVILINSDEHSFKILVPYLIFTASILLAAQVPLKRWLNSRIKTGGESKYGTMGAAVFLFLTAVYGGYFGAGVSVMVIAALGILYDDPLNRLNVLKQAISFSINISAALYFVFYGTAEWMVVLVMSAGAIVGGLSGGTFVEKVNPDAFRVIVVGIGIVISLIYFISQFTTVSI